MARGRGLVGGSNPPGFPFGGLFSNTWASIEPTLATCAGNPANPAHPERFLGVPKQSRMDVFRFFIDFDALRTSEIIEKPQENHGFGNHLGRFV